MIYTMARDIEDDLRARKWPVRVEYGPVRPSPEWYDPVIVIERDREQGDAVPVPKAQRTNPRMVTTRALGVLATVYARSYVAGAGVHDHEYACDDVVDALLVALYRWGVESKAGAISVTQAGYVPAVERADIEQWPGVVYRLRFQVPRAVLARDGAGQAQPTGAPTAVSNVTHVRLAHGDPEAEPETGCGG